MRNIKAADEFLIALGEELKDMSTESIIAGTDETRKLLESILTTIDAVNVYKSLRVGKSTAAEPEVAVEVPAPAEPSPVMAPPVVDSEWEVGVFTRKVHGGAVDFGKNRIKNITESMVLTFKLEHGAKVLGKLDDNGLVTIKEVLENGDDNNSSIRHVVGCLVKDFGDWCVSPLDDKDTLYTVHYKDVQNRNDLEVGAPCVYNIDMKYPRNDVRISKILEHKTNQEVAAAAEPVTPAAPAKKPIGRPRKPKVELEPFLAGCTVVVLGGQKKWFESAVSSTGAKFVHENGKTPDRVIPELKKAQALCILETSTSHHAYLDCKEVAKKHGVPMFKIEGSKKYVYNTLEANREVIKAANRK